MKLFRHGSVWCKKKKELQKKDADLACQMDSGCDCWSANASCRWCFAPFGDCAMSVRAASVGTGEIWMGVMTWVVGSSAALSSGSVQTVAETRSHTRVESLLSLRRGERSTVLESSACSCPHCVNAACTHSVSDDTVTVAREGGQLDNQGGTRGGAS